MIGPCDGDVVYFQEHFRGIHIHCHLVGFLKGCNVLRMERS